ncbi:MAG: YciI family protein [Chthoniobacter sp.]|uniref:YciI family protein n=1 Tax=Chthoniobacter sp. TaxID=2510640 RepID=UPI0032A1F23F
MQFMMLMIPAVYQPGNKVDPGFTPDPKKMEDMGRFNEELGKAVKILSLNGLHPQSTGARVSFAEGQKPTVTDGPFIETKEVLGGYWMVEAASKEELVQWAQRCPADPGDVIEIRQIFDAADFEVKK